MRVTLTTLINTILCFFLFISCNQDDDGLTDQATVLVDFAVPEPNIKSMNGFLHGINIDKPDDSLITLLEPKLLRSGSGTYASYTRKARLSKKNILILSDLWYNGPGKAFSVMPFDDYGVYKDFLEKVIEQTKGEVIYDVWNEPDVGFLWTGSQQQFHECFKFTHDVIRNKLGSKAKISGPSMHFLPDHLVNFAKFCNSNNVKLDVFSYHELYDTDDVSEVRQHVQFVKQITSKYKNMGVEEVHVNEYGYHGSQHNPALIWGYLNSLEKGGADGACRACWMEEENTIGTCWNGSIGGLLTADELKPRASWWAHRLYAESIDKRVQSLSSAPFLASFAYQVPNNQKKARIILANAHKKETIKQLTLSINNITSLPFIEKKDVSVIIKTYEVPDKGEASLENIVLIQEQTYPLYRGNTEIIFYELNPFKNYILEISRDI